MKICLLRGLILLGCCWFALYQFEQVYAQQPGNLTKMIEEKYTTNMKKAVGFEGFKYYTITSVKVNYESPTTILVSGDLIERNLGQFNSDLWQATDLLKNQYGFKIQQVMTSGVGSVANPTIVYILMIK
jgi:hypothetical protein